MLYLLMGVLGVFLVTWILHYLRLSLAYNWRKAGLKIILVLAVIALLWLTITGRLHWLATLGTLFLVLLRYLWTALQYAPLAEQLWRMGRRSGAGKVMETDWLTLYINPATEGLDGLIRMGIYQNRNLSGLSSEELENLRDQVTQDPASLRALAVWLQQAKPEAGVTAPRASLSREDALKVLGLTGTPNREEIIKAHKRLMQKCHPDRGGSDYLVILINEAKDILIAACNKD